MWFDSEELQILIKAMYYYKDNIVPYVPFDNSAELVQEIIYKLENEEQD